MQAFKVAIQVKYGYEPDSDTPCQVEIGLFLPSDERGQLHYFLRSATMDIGGKILTWNWGRSVTLRNVPMRYQTECYRLKNWTEARAFVQNRIEEILGILQRVLTHNYKNYEDCPEDETREYLLTPGDEKGDEKETT